MQFIAKYNPFYDVTKVEKKKTFVLSHTFTFDWKILCRKVERTILFQNKKG